MTLGIYVFGHGGGVPGGDAGDTNFAIIPDMAESVNGYEALMSHPYWLVDIGPETMLKICGAWPGMPSTVHNLQGIILTHAHADHAGGLSSLAWRLRFIEKRKVGLVLHKALLPIIQAQTVELLHNNRSESALTLDDFFDMDVMDFGTSVRDTNLWLSFFPVDHNIGCHPEDFPALGVKVTKDGKQVVFSGDTATPIQPYLVREADVIFHDVQFYDPGSPKAVHCAYPALKGMVDPEYRSKVYLAHTLWEPPKECFEDGFKWASKGTLVKL